MADACNNNTSELAQLWPSSSRPSCGRSGVAAGLERNLTSGGPSEGLADLSATRLACLSPFGMDWNSQADSLKDIDLERIKKAFKRATEHFGLCRNRVWAVAKSLDMREHALPDRIPEKIEGMVGHHGHDQCTLDFSDETSRKWHSAMSALALAAVASPRAYFWETY